MFALSKDKDMPLIRIQRHDQPAYYHMVEEESDGKPMYFDIKEYIKSREYPPNASENDKRTLRRLAMSFFLNGYVLYKKNHDMVLLRSVDNINKDRLL